MSASIIWFDGIHDWKHPDPIGVGPALDCPCGVKTRIHSLPESECVAFYCAGCGEGHRFSIAVGMTEIRVAYLGTLPAIDVIVNREAQP